MSLNADITSLSNALQAFTYGQSIVAENIANVDTVGYTSEVLNLDSLNDFGGVAVAGVGSTRNTFLYNQIYGQLALQGFTAAQMTALSSISSILPATGAGSLTAEIDSLSSDWKALSLDPTSTAAQTQILNDMQTLAILFNTDSSLLFQLQQNINTQTVNDITQVNSLEDQILSLNQQIVDLGGQQGAQTSTLIDQRQVDAQALVGLTGADVNYDTNGAMVITFNGGTLVDGVQAYHLGAMASAIEPGLTDIGYIKVPGSSTLTDVTSDFTNGTLGGLYAGQANVQQAVLTINQMASGIIQFSNEVNESSAAPDGSINGLFTGSEASDIAVNPALANNLGYILAGDDANNPGNLALVQSAMTTLNMYSEIETFNPTPGSGGIELNAGTPIDPTKSFALQEGLFANPAPDLNGGTMVINVQGSNAADIVWTSADTLNTIVAQINAKLGGSGYATLQTIPAGATYEGQQLTQGGAGGQFIHIYTDAPTSIYDQSGNLANVLQLGSVLVSSAPINSVPTTGINQVDQFEPLNYNNNLPPPFTIDNPLSLFTQPVTPPTGGTVTVDNDPATTFTWNANDTINQIMGFIQGAAPANYTVYAGFNQPPFAPNQEVAVFSVPTGPLPYSAGNSVQSGSVDDLTGNLTKVLNLNTDTNASQLFSQLTTTVANTTAAVTNENTQANNLVYATQSLQNEGGPKSPNLPDGQPQAPVSNVNIGAQLAQAAIYENAYDAAVRLQYVLESMLNYLITGVGSPNSNSSPMGS